MTPETLFVTACQVPGCNWRFENATLRIPIVGKTTVERAILYVQKLAEHLQKKHKECMGPALMAMQNMYGTECLKWFRVEDPALLAIVEEIRHSLALAVQAPHPFTNPFIVDRVARIGLDLEQQNQVVTLMLEMRDFLLEKDRKQASQVVTPNPA